MSESVQQPRLGLLMFTTVSVAFMAGIVVAIFVIRLVSPDGNDIPVLVGLLVTLLPCAAGALGFLFVARFETGRKGLGALAVLFGGLAATVVLVPLGLLGLVIAASAAGGFAVYARRLLDSKPSA